MNIVMLNGRLTNHPQLHITTNGKPICNWTLKVKRDYTDAEGRRGSDFIDCIAFGKTAEHVYQYYKKGKPMLIKQACLQSTSLSHSSVRMNVVRVIVTEVEFNLLEFQEKEMVEKKP